MLSELEFLYKQQNMIEARIEYLECLQYEQLIRDKTLDIRYVIIPDDAGDLTITEGYRDMLNDFAHSYYTFSQEVKDKVFRLLDISNINKIYMINRYLIGSIIYITDVNEITPEFIASNIK